ncbi:hypothetical protein [Altererythrobacter epoxidivorans]|nr:hypothetical protein [Altererythrobacter epoxidivorans]
MHRLKNLGRLAGAIATVTMLVPYPASAQQPSEQAQLFSLVSQAEWLDRKCDAFTPEGQFVYREMRRRLMLGRLDSEYDQLLARVAPNFTAPCGDLPRREALGEIRDYFNRQGEFMLALHHFLPADTACKGARDTAHLRPRAARAWQALSARGGDAPSAEVMASQAEILEDHCQQAAQSPVSFMAPGAHLGTFMAQDMEAIYAKPAAYRGTIVLRYLHDGEAPDFDKMTGFRDPDETRGEDMVAAGAMTLEGGFELAVLTDSRLVLTAAKGEYDAHPVPARAFLMAGATSYEGSRVPGPAGSTSARFVFDRADSAALLASSTGPETVTIRLLDETGAERFAEKEYEVRRRRGREIVFEKRKAIVPVEPFRMALEYHRAPRFD